jgi:hypothetical protein
MTGEIMNFQFTDKDFFDDCRRFWELNLKARQIMPNLFLKNPESGRQIILEIYEEVEYLGRKSNLLVVHTGTSHMQMHNCAGFIPSEMLGEVAFISEKRRQYIRRYCRKRGQYFDLHQCRQENSDR